jgi:hypothetical protein
MTAEGKKPAVICDGRLFFGAQQSSAAVLDATLTAFDGWKRRSNAF